MPGSSRQLSTTPKSNAAIPFFNEPLHGPEYAGRLSRAKYLEKIQTLISITFIDCLDPNKARI